MKTTFKWLFGICIAVNCFGHEIAIDIKKMSDQQTQVCSPIVSTYRFNMLSDHFYQPGSPFNYDKINDGDMVYVTLRFMKSFVENFLPKLKAKIIVYSGIVYDAKTDCINNEHEVVPALESMLDNDQVMAWFGKNIRIEHPKAHILPLGFCWKSYYKYRFISKLFARLNVDDFFQKKQIHTYVNFKVTHPRRKELLNTYKNKKKFSFMKKSLRKPFQSFMEELTHSQFTICPRGLNPDCYRTWEALYAGSIPVVERMGIEKLYEDLPVIIVDDLKDITREFLDAKLIEMSKQNYNLKKLHFNYWVDLIRKKQAEIRGG